MGISQKIASEGKSLKDKIKTAVNKVTGRKRIGIAGKLDVARDRLRKK